MRLRIIAWKAWMFAGERVDIEGRFAIFVAHGTGTPGRCSQVLRALCGHVGRSCASTRNLVLAAFVISRSSLLVLVLTYLQGPTDHLMSVLESGHAIETTRMQPCTLTQTTCTADNHMLLM
jgi:hypothetical protein